MRILRQCCPCRTICIIGGLHVYTCLMNIASRLKDLLKCWQIIVNYRPTGLGQIMWLCFMNMVFTKQQNVLLFLFDLCIPY